MEIIKNCGFDPDIGGGISHVKSLIPHIEEYSNIKIITDYHPDFPFESTYSKRTIIRRFPSKPILKNTFRISPNKSFIKRLIYEIQDFLSRKSYLRNTNFDLFHLHGIRLYSALSRVNNYFGIRVYERLINFDFIKRPKVITLHNFYPNKKNLSLTKIYNHYINQFDTIICVDKTIFSYCNKYVQSHNIKKNIHYIPNAIDMTIFYYKPHNPSQNFIIGFAGQLSSTTDLNMLNSLLNNLPEKTEFHLVVGRDTNKIQIPDKLRNRIKVLNSVPNERMADFYHSVDVVFNPVIHSGLTRVTMESMACGRPVIMYNDNSRDSVFFNLQNGFIVNRDIDEILDVINSLKKDFDKVKEIGLAANATIEKNLSTKILLPKLKQVYDDLLENYE